MRRSTFATLLVTGALVASACAAADTTGGTIDDTTPESTSTTTTTADPLRYPHGTEPTDLVLRVETGGGLMPIEFVHAGHPEFSLMGDGAVVTGAAQIAIFPPPALPALQTRHVGEAGIQAILAEADQAGLLAGGEHLDYPCVADAGTTTFTVIVDGETSVTSVYALGIEGPPSLPQEDAAAGSDLPPPEEGSVDDFMRCGLSDEELEARAALTEFNAMLANLESWLPEGSVGSASIYEAEQMRIFSGPYEVNQEYQQEPVTWPLDTGLDEFGDPVLPGGELACGVLSGEDLDQVVTVAAPTNSLTPWLSAGAEWRLTFRALLPDEEGCPADG